MKILTFDSDGGYDQDLPLPPGSPCLERRHRRLLRSTRLPARPFGQLSAAMAWRTARLGSLQAGGTP
jgi:hypothetical protein